METNTKGGAVPSEPMDFSLWREFQDGLSALLDIPLSLYDANGNLIVPSTRQSEICKAVKTDESGRSACREMFLKAVTQAVEKDKIYVYKCHVNLYIFAIPVSLDSGVSFVIVGGHVYLAGNELRDFYEGVTPFGFDEGILLRLRDTIKTIPPKSIFTLPSLVSFLASPFLKCLYSLWNYKLLAGDDSRMLKGFHALEHVYRSIAPVLDRDKLYETIISKSTELVQADRGSLMILDGKNKVLSIKASKGIDTCLATGIKVRLGEGISGSIAKKGLPVIVKNIENEIPSRKNRPMYKTGSFISVPLKLENRVIGVINLSDKTSGGSFSDEDMQLLLSFGNYASIALERGAYYSMSEELKTLSMTDPLTGLFNRRYFHERIFEEVERFKRHSECFTTFMIDIDDFKMVNDTYGHLAGDEVLKSVGKLIRDTVRSIDVVARYGGEEFAVILPHTTKEDSFVIAERIRRGVEELKPENSLIKKRPTISLGVAQFPQDADTIDDLLQRADMAMYRAKKMGKNMVVIYGK